MQQNKLLLVEDDTNLGGILSEYLELKGYSITLCTNGEEGLNAFHEGTFDLCVLDVMMPKKDGFTLAAAIRKENDHIPLIFLTAKSMKEDKIEGFTIGADDYMTKPFSIEELLMRIQAVLRRSRYAPANTVSLGVFPIGSYTFDYHNQLLKQNGTEQHLTAKEAELLKLLAMHMNEVVKREYALKEVWGDDTYFNGRSMDVFLTKIRKYLRNDPKVEIITIHGTGVKLVVSP